MGRTRHIQARMTQRGIDVALLDLVLTYGTPGRNGKVTLSRDDLKRFGAGLDALRRDVQRAQGKGGLVVVTEGDDLVTTYRLAGYRRPD